MSTEGAEADAGPEPESDHESIFSSHSYSALSEGSDEEQSDALDRSGTSSHAFQRLKDLLQQRDHQLNLHTDQKPVEEASLAVSTEKALLKVNAQDVTSRLRLLAHKLFSSSLAHSHSSRGQMTGASGARWSPYRKAMLASMFQMGLMPLWHLKNAGEQHLTPMMQAFQQGARQASLLLQQTQQKCFIFRLSRLQSGRSSGSRNNSM